MHTRRAFTLVELLIVIAIVALLAGIAFAAFGPIRENSRQGVCISNLRQIGQALRMYSADYAGMDPVLGQPLPHDDAGLPGPQQSRPFVVDYVKNRGIFFCPSYHGDVPASNLTLSYTWYMDDGDHLPPQYRFAQVVKLRGTDAPLMSCQEHNAIWNSSTEPRWEPKKVNVLRFDGRVSRRTVSVGEPFPTW